MLPAILNFNNVLRLFYIFGCYEIMTFLPLQLISRTDSIQRGIGIFWPLPEFFWKIVTPELTYYALPVATAVIFFFPEKRIAKFIWCFSALCLVHFYLVTGQQNYHSFHVMIYLSFMFVFFKADDPRRRSLVLSACLVAIGITYFSSGLWKANGVRELILAGKAEKFCMIAINSLAYATAEGSRVSPTCTSILLSSTSMASFAWFYTIATEISGVVVILIPWLSIIWIPMLVFLHFSIGSCLGIWFVPAMTSSLTIWALMVLNLPRVSAWINSTRPPQQKV